LGHFKYIVNYTTLYCAYIYFSTENQCELQSGSLKWRATGVTQVALQQRGHLKLVTFLPHLNL